MNDDIIVSIVCNTYNHEKYIRDALEGFVNQKTNFPFEILIHDDASTDKTADIVREYQQKYPNLVKPIFQAENQHSKKVGISATYQYPRAKGKYIAFCEGDDYWTDPEKLQKQVDAMEKHPEIDICAHRVAAVRNGKTEELVPRYGTHSIFTAEQVILGGGAFVSTNSLVFRRSLLGSEYDYIRLFALDYIIQISGSLRGGMLYLADTMAVYRRMTEGSWTVQTKNNLERRQAHQDRLESVLKVVDAETGYVHTEALTNASQWGRIKLLAKKGALKEILSKTYQKTMKARPIKQRLGVIAMAMWNAVKRS